MTMTRAATAGMTLEELLSLHDEQFVQAAYHSVLNRSPDEVGFHYYLGRIRSGVHKLEILAQMRTSDEGRNRPTRLSDLDHIVKKYEQLKRPFIGPLLRFFNVSEGDQGANRQLRAIDNKLHVLDSKIQIRLDEISANFAQLNQNKVGVNGVGDNQVVLAPPPSPFAAAKPYNPIGDRYAEALAEIKARLKPEQAGAAKVMDGVKISIVMPVYKVPLKYLCEAVDSVKFQIYGNWELCIVDDGSNDRVLSAYLLRIATEDSRIKTYIDPVNRGIAAATNAAIAMSSGTFVALLDNDDILTSDALLQVAAEVRQYPEVDLIYSDECKTDEEGTPTELFCKPDWSPVMLFNCMYTGHLSVYRRTLIDKVGGLRSDYDFSQDYDLALRASEVTKNVRHIAHVLYGWRMIAGSGAQGDKPYARASNIAALQDAAVRRGFSGQVKAEPAANHFRVNISEMSQMVSIIIPSDNLTNIQSTIDTIIDNSIYQKYEIIVVTNSKIIGEFSNVKISNRVVFVPFDKPFNFSEKCNVGAEAATGEIFVFFNDDVRVVSADWIEMILEGFVTEDVGIVGPKLLYENYLIQHAGMVTGVRGLVGTAFHCLPHDTNKHFGAAQWLREVSLICGACLAIKSDLFKQINGFDAINAPISHSDVDLCYRVREAGYSCLYTPHATLIHIGHMSIGETEKKEARSAKKKKLDKSDIFLLRRWGAFTSYDPYFPPAMRDILYHDSPEKWHLHANVPPSVQGGKDILLVSHDLTGSGAPRIVFEMAKVLKEDGHFVVVASPADGTYREQLNAIGIPVIIDELLLRQHDSLARFAKNFDLVIANTAVTWPAVVQLSEFIDVYWYIHEISLMHHLLNVQPGIKDAFTAAKGVWVGSALAGQIVVPYRPDVQILKYGVRPPTNNSNGISAPLRVSLFGSYEPRKGQDLAIAAFATLSQAYRDKLRLNLFGRVLDEAFYRAAEVASRGIYEITLKTELSYERYLEEMLASHVVLVSSRDDTLPFVSIDALGAGKVLLCTSTTGTSTYIRHGISGFIANEPDVNAIAAVLRTTVDRLSDLEKVAQNGRKVFDEEFSVDAFKRTFFAACGL